MKIHGIPRIFRITTHRWEFHRSASTAPSPSPQSLPHHPRGERILVRVNRHSARFRIEFPASRKLSDTLAGRRGMTRMKPWEGTVDAKSARKKRTKREREETKDKKIGRGGSERNAGQDESRQRIRLNFFARDVCPPPLFPPCLAREIQFSCPHASTHDSAYHDDNERPRSTERHPCTSCIHR